ncbi:hypothetical protein L484_007089 [Morus notabilis]|uniref:Uncharacterized protein n=1 Tax=Morus notabilis TaxID=981085 RepID=W9SCY2_9ROSA|nr:hypothetical protein L484_007089 [Morus notabilis]
MSRRPVNPSRRLGDSGGSLIPGSYHSKQKSSPIVSVGLLVFVHAQSIACWPETCSVVSKLLKEEETEAWGVEPYDIEDADRHCIAELLYRKALCSVLLMSSFGEKSFSLVIVSDTLDYLSPRYLNKTLPVLARVSADGLAILVIGELKLQKSPNLEGRALQSLCMKEIVSEGEGEEEI